MCTHKLAKQTYLVTHVYTHIQFHMKYAYIWEQIHIHKSGDTNSFININVFKWVSDPPVYLNIHIPRHRHTHKPTNTCICIAHIPARKACTRTLNSLSSFSSLQLSLYFTLFCSHLQGIISLSNPFPYIKCCFLVCLACSTQRTSCWQHRCFPQKTTPGSRQGDGKERETDPSGTSWKISSFFVCPLKDDKLLFQPLFGECRWTKQASSAGIPSFGAISSNGSDDGALHTFIEFCWCLLTVVEYGST